MAAAPVPQHRAALQTANAVRLERAQVKRDLVAGRKTIRDVLEVHDVPGVTRLDDVSPAVASMTIGELLCVPRRWGPTRMRRLLFRLGIRESTRLDALTDRRRVMIVAAFEGQAAETKAEAQRIAQASAERAERARDQAAAEERAEAERRARVDAAFADLAAERARGPVAPIDVACPHCRSGPGQPCSWYDPVHDRWHEPKTPCTDRLERAGMLS